MKLPKGCKTVEDETALEQLIKDEIFIKSIEDDYGKVKRIFADWENNRIVYVMRSGLVKESELEPILENLRNINYLAQFQH